MSDSARKVTYGLAAAFVLLAVCVLIRPAGLAANDGLSYFGGFATTIVPYSLAFFLNAFFCWEAAKGLNNGHFPYKYAATSLRVMAVLLIGLLLTPHELVNYIHTKIGAALFSFQLVLSIWLLIKVYFNWQNAALVLSELLSGVAALYYLPKAHGLLLQAQVIFQLAFGILLIRVLNKKTIVNRLSSS